MSNIFKGKGETVGKIVGPIIGALIGGVCQIILTKKNCKKIEAETTLVNAKLNNEVCSNSEEANISNEEVEVAEVEETKNVE